MTILVSERRLIYFLGVLALTLFFTSDLANAQENKYVRLSLGAGFPDMVYGSAKFQLSPRAWFGFSGGNYPYDKGSLLSLGAEFELDFHQRENTDAFKPIWFWREGVMYLGDQKQSTSDHYVYLNSSVGGRMYVYKTFGISAELGLAARVFHKKSEIYPGITGWNYDFEKQVFYPAARIEFFTLVGPL